MIKSAFLIVATCCSLQLFSQEKFPDGKIIPDWFYKNEQYDRKLDDRADKNNYRTL